MVGDAKEGGVFGDYDLRVSRYMYLVRRPYTLYM